MFFNHWKNTETIKKTVTSNKYVPIFLKRKYRISRKHTGMEQDAH